MANNYLQTSVSIEKLTPQETAWFKGVLNFVPEDVDDAEKSLLELLGLDSIRSSMLDVFPDFQCSWLPTGNLVLYGEVFVDLEHMADVLQAFLRKFRPGSAIPVTYAETCDSYRPDEFSGGMLFVTAEDVKWWNASSEAEKCVASFSAESGDE